MEKTEEIELPEWIKALAGSSNGNQRKSSLPTPDDFERVWKEIDEELDDS